MLISFWLRFQCADSRRQCARECAHCARIVRAGMRAGLLRYQITQNRSCIWRFPRCLLLAEFAVWKAFGPSQEAADGCLPKKQADEGKWPSKLPQVAKHYDFRRKLTSYHFHLLRSCTKEVCRKLHRKSNITWVRLCTKGVCNRPHRKRCAIAAGSVRHSKTAKFSHFVAEVSETAAWSESHARSMRAACARCPARCMAPRRVT